MHGASIPICQAQTICMNLLNVYSRTCGTVFGSMQKLEYILYQTVVGVIAHKHCMHVFASITY